MTPQELNKMDPRQLLLASEVAELFRVSPKTVVGWAKAKLVPALRLPGGRYRFPVGPIREKLAGE